ncbi:hypothetical protein PR048_028868 [Dryococelus australis]|uniref:Uncharacterized protein n=1 Tax=Dryococelus australis TaxID=614101 RepID=A0ABQ9GBR5_9NEOP|nr:hypothetical protein PR048_028868 [Dryococelus australis]
MNAVKYRVVSGVVWTNRTMLQRSAQQASWGVHLGRRHMEKDAFRCSTVPSCRRRITRHGLIPWLVEGIPAYRCLAMQAPIAATGYPDCRSRVIGVFGQAVQLRDMGNSLLPARYPRRRQAEFLIGRRHPLPSKQRAELCVPTTWTRYERTRSLDAVVGVTSIPPTRRQLLISRLGEPGSTPGEVATGHSHVEIVPDGAACRRVFSGVSPTPADESRRCSITHLGSETSRVIVVKVEQRRNERAGEMGDSRENLTISGIVRHDSRMRKFGSDPSGDWTRFTLATSLQGLPTCSDIDQFLSENIKGQLGLHVSGCPRREEEFVLPPPLRTKSGLLRVETSDKNDFRNLITCIRPRDLHPSFQVQSQEFKRAPDLQARLYSRMYKYADINRTSVVCCHHGRWQLDTVLQEVSNINGYLTHVKMRLVISSSFIRKIGVLIANKTQDGNPYFDNHFKEKAILSGLVTEAFGLEKPPGSFACAHSGIRCRREAGERVRAPCSCLACREAGRHKDAPVLLLRSAGTRQVEPAEANHDLGDTTCLSNVPGGVVVRLLASHQGEPGSIPGRATPGFSQVGIVLVGGFSRVKSLPNFVTLQSLNLQSAEVNFLSTGVH